MTDNSDDLIDPTEPTDDQSDDVLTPRIYWGMLIVLQTAMAIELVLLLFEQQWLNATLVLGSIGLTMAPAMLTPRLYVRIPAEFQLLAIGFVFASLFLGESLSYYDRFPW